MEKLIALLLMPFTVLLYAINLTLFWGWFVIPMGAPDIGLAQAYGVALLVRLLTHDAYVARDERLTEAGPLAAVVVSVVFNLVFLAFGFITHLVMVA